LVGIRGLGQFDHPAKCAGEAFPSVDPGVFAGLGLFCLALPTDDQQPFVDRYVKALGVDARSERDDLDRVVRRSDIDLRKGAESPGAYAGRKAAEQTRHLLLQAVELVEKVVFGKDVTHGQFSLERQEDEPAYASLDPPAACDRWIDARDGGPRTGRTSAWSKLKIRAAGSFSRVAAYSDRP